MAMAVTNPFDPSTHHVLDPQFGRIRFRSFGWGQHEDGNFYLYTEELKSHNCSPEELGLAGQ